MTYGILLAVHIMGAVVTGLVALFAVITMWRGNSSWYRPNALMLGALGAFEVLSGIALAVVSIQITAPSLCANIAVYLSIVFAVEALLWMRMKKVSMLFPLVPVLSPVMASLAFFLVAIQLGF